MSLKIAYIHKEDLRPQPLRRPKVIWGGEEQKLKRKSKNKKK